MGKLTRPLGSAAVQFNDYVGTAAADDADAVVNARSLYQIAGLDRDRWTIVSIDVEQDTSEHRVTVYAFDRQRHPVRSYADLLELEQEKGELPVTAFHLDDPSQVEDFRNEAFKRMAVRLTLRALTDTRLTIDEHAELQP
jgi:hypothetical protein